MRLRAIPLIVSVALAILVAPLTAEAQQPTKKVPRIGVLSPQPSTEPPTVQREPFARGLRALGWTPGVDLLIEYRYAEGDVGRLPALAAELVQLPVDVIVARGNTAIHAVQQATAHDPDCDGRVRQPGGAGIHRQPGSAREEHDRIE